MAYAKMPHKTVDIFKDAVENPVKSDNRNNLERKNTCLTW